MHCSGGLPRLFPILAVRAVGTFAACLFQGKPREKFSEPHEVNRYPISRDDQAHSNDNQQDTATYPQREGLPEDHHPEEDRRDRFQGTEDCRRCRTDVLDGAGCTQKRDRRRENGQCKQVPPQVPFIGHMDCHAEIQPDNVKQQPEKQDVECHLERRNGFQHRTVHADDINCIGQSRNHHQNRPRDIECRTVTAFEQQPDTGQCQQDAQCSLRGELLPEAEGHDQRYENRIYEQQRRGDAGIHVIVAQEQGQGRKGDQQSQEYQRHDLTAVQLEIPAAGLEHDAQQRDGEKIAEKQYRLGIHPRLVEREGKERVHAVSSCGDSTQKVTFGFRIHRSDFAAKIAFISSIDAGRAKLSCDCHPGAHPSRTGTPIPAGEACRTLPPARCGNDPTGARRPARLPCGSKPHGRNTRGCKPRRAAIWVWPIRLSSPTSRCKTARRHPVRSGAPNPSSG